MGMTEKQKRFADEYLIDLNGTRAYKVAYPNTKKDETAAANAARLIRNDKVKTYIDEQLEKIHNEKTADAQEVLEYLTAVMRGETESSVLSLCGDGCQEILEKPPDEKERLKAAELLGKRYSLFSDKVEVSGSLETETSKLDDLIKQLRSGSDGG